AGKPAMPKTFSRHTSTGGPAAAQLRFVKTYSPPYILVTEIAGIKFLYSPGVQKPFPAVVSSLEVHLHDLGHPVRIAKQPCMAADAPLHGRAHIVYIPL